MKAKKGNIFIIIGLLLISAALLITVYNVYENLRAKRSSQQALIGISEQIQLAKNQFSDNEIPLYERYDDMFMPEIDINGVKYIGVLKIPALNLELPVKGDYSEAGLVTAPCRYKGSVYKDNMIIAGHNYASHFGYIRRLKIGDRVSFVDGDGNEFLYEVAEFQQLDGKAVEAMQEGQWDLTLFTCTVSGKNRITVRLDKMKG